MSIRAYKVIEKEFEGEIWHKASRDDSFNLWAIGDELVNLLMISSFYDRLNEDCVGTTIITREEIEYIKSEIEEDKEKYDKPFVHDFILILLEDMGEEDYVEYKVY